MIIRFVRLEFELFTEPSKSDFLRDHQQLTRILSGCRKNFMNKKILI